LDKSAIKKLLIPLDGTILAESAVPPAAQLAKKIGVDVTLIHVLEKDPPEKIHGQSHLTTAAEAGAYLASVASREIFGGVRVETHVHESGVSDVPRSISEHSEELNEDLVVMCSHGNDALKNFLFGSLAQQVISFGNTPVLLVRPPAAGGEMVYPFDNFLLPLDGNPDHEQAIRYSSVLAGMCRATIHLLSAIPHFGTMSGELTAANRYLPGTTTKMMDMIVPDAAEYLRGILMKLEQKGLTVTATISRNEPAAAIAETARTVHADIIVLATHGRKGTQAFWEGSVTPKVSKATSIPILLVPVQGERSMVSG
jgi:nucleotide-binding universal stress UspA family protein